MAGADILKVLPVLRWLWVAAIVVGVTVCGWTLREAFIDARWVKANSANSAKRIQAAASLRKAVVIFGFQVALLLIRVWCLTWPAPVSLDTPFAAFVRNWGWDATLITILQVVLAYESVLDYRDRKRVMGLVRPKALWETGPRDRWDDEK